MGSLPSGTSSKNQPVNTRTRFAAFLNNTFIPTWQGSVELSAFGMADTCSITTFLDGSPDYGAISQSGKYIPFIIKVGTIGAPGLNSQLLAAYLEEIDTDYSLDADTIEIHGRGILAPLIDKRLTAKLNQNQDITAVISQIFSSVPGLSFNVNDGKPANVQAGKILSKDNVSTVRNMRAMDYINTLAAGVGWRTRVVGATVIVGPPNTNSPVLSKVWGSPVGGQKCTIKHNALHAHNIHVRVVSYLRANKQTTYSKAGPNTPSYQNPAPNTLVQTSGTIPSKSKLKSSGGTGRQTGIASGNIPNVGEQEEYTFSVPGKTAAECDQIASQIQAEISRHEFIAELTWAPSPSEIQFLCANGTEWQLQLSGLSQASHNQVYHPKRIVWTYSESEGLIVNVLAVNHIIPQGDSESL